MHTHTTRVPPSALRRVALLPMLALLGALAALAPLSAATAQKSMMDDPEVANYRLSMDKVRKVVQVQRNMYALAKSDPDLVKRIEGENQANRPENPTVAQAAALLDRHPEVRRVFTSAGTTSREYLLTLSAWFGASAAAMVKKMDANAAAKLEQTAAQKANVVLVEANQAELEKIGTEFQQLQKEWDKLKKAEKEGDEEAGEEEEGAKKKRPPQE